MVLKMIAGRHTYSQHPDSKELDPGGDLAWVQVGVCVLPRPYMDRGDFP